LAQTLISPGHGEEEPRREKKKRLIVRFRGASKGLVLREDENTVGGIKHGRTVTTKTSKEPPNLNSSKRGGEVTGGLSRNRSRRQNAESGGPCLQLLSMANAKKKAQPTRLAKTEGGEGPGDRGGRRGTTATLSVEVRTEREGGNDGSVKPR